MTAHGRPAGWRERLIAPVDNASLVFFRIAFGAAMLWEATRYLSHGWVRDYWIEPDYNFTYRFFEWVTPWPGEWMIVHFWMLGALGIAIALGLFYRLAAALFFVGFTHVFLLEQAQYLNHFYLVALLALLTACAPLHRRFSLDVLRKPALRSASAPAWALRMLQAQIAIPYFYGGIAKLNGDWLRGNPMRAWLAKRSDFPVLGRFFETEWAPWFFSYSGLLIDLLVVPLLMLRRTRLAAFTIVTAFHLLNARLFSIGVFPWFMIVATTLFFEPDWPLQILRSSKRRKTIAAVGAVVGVTVGAWFQEGLDFLPVLASITAGTLIAWECSGPSGPSAAPPPAPPALTRLSAGQRLTTACLGLWFTIQCLVPLRHLWIEGNVSWTEEGHRFAWHMKLRDKRAEARFSLTDPRDGTVTTLDLRERLTRRQARKMATRPYLMHRLAREIASEYAAAGIPGVEVRVHCLASLNGRPEQPLIDDTVDLAATPETWGHATWILPLAESGD